MSLLTWYSHSELSYACLVVTLSSLGIKDLFLIHLFLMGSRLKNRDICRKRVDVSSLLTHILVVMWYFRHKVVEQLKSLSSILDLVVVLRNKVKVFRARLERQNLCDLGLVT